MKANNKGIILIGFQASGKSTLGQLLAHHLKYSFIDSDQLIERYHPLLSCRDIFQNFGVNYFRELEANVLASLKMTAFDVLATGGGVLTHSTNGNILKSKGWLIYLQASAETLKARLWQRLQLPSFLNTNNPEQTFYSIYQERIPFYEKWADQTLNVDDLDEQKALENLINIVSTYHRHLS